jgi:hypothetical protein
MAACSYFSPIFHYYREGDEGIFAGVDKAGVFSDLAN